MAETRIKKRWIVVCLILLLFSGQIPSCMMVNTPKFGRVVDTSTGQGMPDVAVIAVGHFRAQGLIHGSAAEYPYRIVTRTDADGKYWIPNTWLHLRFALPGTDAMQMWMITAFKPGYAIVGDERAWSSFDEYGMAKNLPKSTWESPSAWWLGLVVRVNPIKMYRVRLSLKESSTYYRAVTILGSDISRVNLPEEKALKTATHTLFLSEVCSVGPESTMDSFEAGAMASFSLDKNEFLHKLRILEPDGFEKIAEFPVLEDGYHHSIFRASDVCEALKAGDRTP